MNNELLFCIATTFLDDIGVVSTKNLIAYLGNAEAIFTASKKKLYDVPGIGKQRIESIIASKGAALKRAEDEILFIQKNAIKPIFFTDKNYPKRLLQQPDSPSLIYYKGNADLNSSKIISIVGTRRITDYGKSQCEKLVESLSQYSPVIVSGLAYGVDVTAHKAAIKNNIPTVAVVANGFDKMYPADHTKYLKNMVANGGIISEYGSGQVADKQNFPQRNRIVAGICDALIVIETAAKGGAMITASLANSYNKDVFALPGKTTDEYSAGCNYLIKTNQAMLFENVEDIVNALMWDVKNNVSVKQKKIFDELTEQEKTIIETISKSEKISIDELVFQSKMPTSIVANLLLNLELRGDVKTLPGKQYKLIE